tara:strand:+ start:258 stop:569 length:312 start_codon:yes stop_codon:yes gene_type:complete
MTTPDEIVRSNMLNGLYRPIFDSSYNGRYEYFIMMNVYKRKNKELLEECEIKNIHVSGNKTKTKILQALIQYEIYEREKRHLLEEELIWIENEVRAVKLAGIY